MSFVTSLVGLLAISAFVSHFFTFVIPLIDYPKLSINKICFSNIHFGLAILEQPKFLQCPSKIAK